MQPLSLKELALSADRDLFQGRTTAAHLVKEYSSDEKKTENQRFFKKLAKILSDPRLDFPSIIQVAKKDWQIMAFSEGLSKNPIILEFWDADSAGEVFDDAKEIHQNEPSLQKAIDAGKMAVTSAITMYQKKLPEERPKNIDAYIDSSKLNVHIDDSSIPQKMISWELFTALIHSGLALRHVSLQTLAENELVEGAYGDALSISSGIFLFIYKLIKEDKLPQRNVKEFFCEESREAMLRNLVTTLQKLSQNEKQIILSNFERALRQFIYKSTFCYDNPIPYNSAGWKTSWEKGLSASSSFIICVKHPKSIPYDEKQYMNLGKYGKSSIDPKSMKFAISPPSCEEIAKFQEGIEDVTDQIVAIYKAAVNRYLKQIIEKITGYCDSQNKEG